MQNKVVIRFVEPCLTEQERLSVLNAMSDVAWEVMHNHVERLSDGMDADGFRVSDCQCSVHSVCRGVSDVGVGMVQAVRFVSAR